MAVVKNLSDSKAYGYLLDGSATNALQVDMSGLLALTPGSDGHQVTTAPAAGIIKSIAFFID